LLDHGKHDTVVEDDELFDFHAKLAKEPNQSSKKPRIATRPS
jgi:hypothetical protein